jgi:hypothetical protein
MMRDWRFVFLVGWAASTFGGAVATYGFHAMTDGGSSFGTHLANWSTISIGALVFLLGAVAVTWALVD